MTPMYVPRESVSMLLALPDAPNKAVCVVIPYKGYEVSVAMDSSHRADADLRRSSLCVFSTNDASTNVTPTLFPEFGSSDVPAHAGSLMLAFSRIDELVAATTSP